MSDNIDLVLDGIVRDLRSIVTAETERAVHDLQTKIKGAIATATKELQSAVSLRDEKTTDTYERQGMIRKAH
jgi:hypothetical protein